MCSVIGPFLEAMRLFTQYIHLNIYCCIFYVVLLVRKTNKRGEKHETKVPGQTGRFRITSATMTHDIKVLLINSNRLLY